MPAIHPFALALTDGCGMALSVVAVTGAGPGPCR